MGVKFDSFVSINFKKSLLIIYEDSNFSLNTHWMAVLFLRPSPTNFSSFVNNDHMLKSVQLFSSKAAKFENDNGFYSKFWNFIG